MGLLVALRRPAPLHGRETLTAPEQGAAGTRTTPGGASNSHALARSSKLHRLADGFALALIVGGAGLFLYARHRLQLLAANKIERVEHEWAVAQFVRWWHLSDAGLWTAGAGLALAVALAIWQWRRNSSPARP